MLRPSVVFEGEKPKHLELALFNMYKSDSKKILELVNKVLNHEMTTREMLVILGLLHKDNNVIFLTV